jgi:hypothetical protein
MMRENRYAIGDGYIIHYVKITLSYVREAGGLVVLLPRPTSYT